MKSILVELRCSYCGYKTHKKSEQLIISQFEPKFRLEILQDTFFQHECPCCHHMLSFLHNCLYQDEKHKFLILLKINSQEEITLLEDSKYEVKRLVKSKQELQEKIRIFEDNLNDIVMECLKFKLTQKMNLQKKDYITYHDYDIDSNTLWFEIHVEDMELIAISREYYKDIEKKLPHIKKDEIFTIVNEHEILKFI